MLPLPPHSPFATSLGVFDASLRFTRPWTLAPTASATPTTSLRGALGEAIARSPDLAPLDGWLRKPPSRHHPNQLPPRLLLRVAPAADPHVWTLRAILRGPHSNAHVDLLRAALTRAGERGLLQRGEPSPFALDDVTVTATTAAAHIRQRLAHLGAPLPTRVLIEFVTPCEAESFAPAELTGNLACALVKLDHAQRDDPTATKRAIDDEADAARDAARDDFARTRVTHEALVLAAPGERVSGETGHAFPLQGSHGLLTLEGELADALPWLALAELHGVGRRTAFGLGHVRLAWP